MRGYADQRVVESRRGLPVFFIFFLPVAWSDLSLLLIKNYAVNIIVLLFE